MHQPTLLGGWLSAHTKEGGNGSGDKSEEWNAFEALFYNKNKLFYNKNKLFTNQYTDAECANLSLVPTNK